MTRYRMRTDPPLTPEEITELVALMLGNATEDELPRVAALAPFIHARMEPLPDEPPSGEPAP